MSEPQQTSSIWGKVAGWLIKKVLPDAAQGQQQGTDAQQSGTAAQQSEKGSLLQRLGGLVGGTDGVKKFLGGIVDDDLKPLLEMLKNLLMIFVRIANAIGNDRSTPTPAPAAAMHGGTPTPPPIPTQENAPAQTQAPTQVPQVAQTVETAPAPHPLIFPADSRYAGLNGFAEAHPSCHPLPPMGMPGMVHAPGGFFRKP